MRVRGLVKSYSGVPAVRGIDLDIRRGEIFALLGPNGAGKTTTVEILEGYRHRDGGDVSVLGCDPGRDRAPPEAADRDRVAVDGRRAVPHGGRDGHDVRGVLPASATRRRSHRGGRFDRQTRRTGDPTLGWSATPTRRRDRARGRSRAVVPRRTDDRFRSVRSARSLGRHQEPRQFGQDRAVDDPLHGRGAVLGRSGRRRRGRSHRRRGSARVPRPPRSCPSPRPLPTDRRHGAPGRARGRTARTTGSPKCAPTTSCNRCTTSRAGRSTTASSSKDSKSPVLHSRTSTSR